MIIIKSAIVFTDVAAGASSTAAHNLNTYVRHEPGVPHGVDTDVRPDVITLSAPGFTATATATNVTVTNNNLEIASCTALCEYWQKIEREMAADPLTVADAFVATAGLSTADVLEFPYRTATATPVDVTAADYIIGVDYVTGPVTVNLPSAVTVGAGKCFVIKDAGPHAAAQTITLTPTGGQTIDGGANYPLSVDYAKVTIVSDGANWLIIGD